MKRLLTALTCLTGTMLTGCVQDLTFSDVNRDTVDVLLANGCEVVTPGAQHCCGSLHAHNGELVVARAMASATRRTAS